MRGQSLLRETNTTTTNVGAYINSPLRHNSYLCLKVKPLDFAYIMSFRLTLIIWSLTSVQQTKCKLTDAPVTYKEVCNIRVQIKSLFSSHMRTTFPNNFSFGYLSIQPVISLFRVFMCLLELMTHWFGGAETRWGKTLSALILWMHANVLVLNASDKAFQQRVGTIIYFSRFNCPKMVLVSQYEVSIISI